MYTQFIGQETRELAAPKGRHSVPPPQTQVWFEEWGCAHFSQEIMDFIFP